MLLKFKNLKIRNATADDAEQLAIWWNDGAIMAHAGFPNGLGEIPENIVESLKCDSDETRRRLIIEIDNIASGEMVYRNIGEYTAEIGIKICDFSLHNMGLGKVLLSMLIDSLFNDMGFKKIVLDTNLNNKRAQHVYETLGFTIVSVNKNSWKDQLGEWQSSVDYELFPENFINYAK